jgi:hypothetical protein
VTTCPAAVSLGAPSATAYAVTERLRERALRFSARGGDLHGVVGRRTPIGGARCRARRVRRRCSPARVERRTGLDRRASAAAWGRRSPRCPRRERRTRPWRIADGH